MTIAAKTKIAAKSAKSKTAAKGMSADVIRSKPRAPRTATQSMRRKYRLQRGTAYILAGVFVVGLALSLKHQAAGIAAIIHAETLEAWFMAILIDAGFIGLELASIFAATPGIAKSVGKFTTPAIIVTVLASAAMNTVAFLQHASGCGGIIGAVLAGCFIPGFLFVLTKVGTKLYMTAK